MDTKTKFELFNKDIKRINKLAYRISVSTRLDEEDVKQNLYELYLKYIDNFDIDNKYNAKSFTYIYPCLNNKGVAKAIKQKFAIKGNTQALVDKVHNIKHHNLSLDYVNDGGLCIDIADKENNYSDLKLDYERILFLARNVLSKREKDIVRAYTSSERNMTLQEIGECYNCSPQRIDQIYRRCVKKIKRKISSLTNRSLINE